MIGIPKVFSRKKKDAPPPQLVYERPLRFTEVQDKKKRQKRRVVFTLTLLALFLFIASIGGLYSFFTVKQVVCMTEEEACDSALIAVAQTVRGKSMFSNLSLSHSFLTVQTRRIWPNGARVKFLKPELLLTFTPTQEGIAPFSLTKTGILVSFTIDLVHLPPVHDVQLEAKHMGDHADTKTLQFYEHFLTDMQKLMLPQITEVTVNDDDTIVFKLDENSQAIADKEHIDGELQSLQTLLLSPVVERRGKTIDLRFENPVVK